MTIASLYPGQGSDFCGCAQAHDREGSKVRAHLDLAAGLLTTHREALLMRGCQAAEPTEKLQPTLTAILLGIAASLQDGGVRTDFHAGHSMGEVPALGAACGIKPEPVLRYAAERGRLMANRADANPGGMLALSGISREALGALIGRVPGVRLAAHNAPTEWVISGSDQDLEVVACTTRHVKLNVRGPWHGPEFQPEARALLAFGEGLDLSAAMAPTVFVSNQAGESVTSASQALALLANQLVRPVDWVSVMKTLVDAGVTDYVLIGPAKVLRGLLRHNSVPGNTHLTETPEQLARTIEALRGQP